jgi:beta-glucosidase
MPFVCTINEPQAVSLIGHVLGLFPPGHTDVEEGLAVNARLMEAHRVAVAAVRAGKGAPQVGLPMFLPPVEPARADDAESAEIADLIRAFMVDSYLDDLIAGGDVGDWLGLHYYTRLRVDAATPGYMAAPPDGAETTLMGWEVYPAGFRTQLDRVRSVGLPIYITENGIATADDAQRLRFLASHLSVLKEAIDDGVDVRGYLHWSAFDNFEWAHGYEPTFGLIEVDRATMHRSVRPSARAYARLIRTGSLAALTSG